MNIFLIGFMGSGKTTIGKMLSKELGLSFVDLDHTIESEKKCSISEIFASIGENEFRKLEHHHLKQICSQKDLVVSVGGGAPCFYNNMELMNENGRTVYLKLSAMALSERFLHLPVAAQITRPLLARKTKEELNEFISQTLQKREPFYEKASIIVSNESSDVYQAVDRIKRALK